MGTTVVTSGGSENGIAFDAKAMDAWGSALAEMLWSNPKVREKMSAQFQKVVDKMVEVSLGSCSR